MNNLVLNNKRFFIFWFSQYISSIANSFHLLILPLWFYSISASKLSTGIIFIIELVVYTVFSPIAGVVVDKSNKKLLIILCDIGRGFLILTLFYIRSADLYWVVYCVAFFTTFLASLYQPLSDSAVQSLVDKENLTKANSLISFSFGTTLIIGPICGAIISEKFGYNFTFLLNSISFFIASFGSTFILFKPNIKSKATMYRDLLEGFTVLSKNPKFMKLFITQFVTYIVVGANSFLFVVYLNDLGATANQIATFMMFQGIGILIGSSVYPWLKRKSSSQDSLIKITTFSMGLALIVFINTALRVQGLGHIAIAVFGSFFVSFGITVRVTLQSETDVNYIGRVSSISRMLIQSASGISMGLSVLLVNFISANVLVSVGGILLISTSIILNLNNFKVKKVIEHEQ